MAAPTLSQRQKNLILIAVALIALVIWDKAFYRGPSSGAGDYAAQVCNGWNEITAGVANETLTNSEVNAKLDTMKSNAEALGSSNSILQSDVLQLRAALENNGDDFTQTTAEGSAVTTDCAGVQ